MMKIFPATLTLSFLLLAFTAQTQIYKTNIGIRLDESQFGLSLDQKIYKQLTAQVALDAKSREVKATAFARYHLKIIGRRLNIYPAVGVHTGSYKDRGGFSGFDLLIGAEYKMLILPVVLSFDFSPAFHTAGNHPDWWNLQSVFSIKYILIKDKKKLFRKR